jgi:hypothetical protein
MGDSSDSDMEWNEPFFRDCVDASSKIVIWVSRKQEPFTRFQMIEEQLIKDKKLGPEHCQKNFKKDTLDTILLGTANIRDKENGVACVTTRERVHFWLESCTPCDT